MRSEELHDFEGVVVVAGVGAEVRASVIAAAVVLIDFAAIEMQFEVVD